MPKKINERPRLLKDAVALEIKDAFRMSVPQLKEAIAKTKAERVSAQPEPEPISEEIEPVEAEEPQPVEPEPKPTQHEIYTAPFPVLVRCLDPAQKEGIVEWVERNRTKSFRFRDGLVGIGLPDQRQALIRWAQKLWPNDWQDMIEVVT